MIDCADADGLELAIAREEIKHPPDRKGNTREKKVGPSCAEQQAVVVISSVIFLLPSGRVSSSRRIGLRSDVWLLDRRV